MFHRARNINENLYISYAGLMLPKKSAWTHEFNNAIAYIRAAGERLSYSENEIKIIKYLFFT
jgi:hypothetical protein